ncbi:MAG: ribosome small subunit-dependent GTPase A [Candidatus Shapirobacteria bacterium]|jgi:ribosome biogenesis GTPase
MHNSLESYGWNAAFERAAQVFADMNLSPARIVETGRDSWKLAAESGDGIEEIDAVVSGKFMYGIDHSAEMPVTGDWVLIRGGLSGDEIAVIHAVLPRISKFSRKAKGDTAYDKVEEQVLVANIDTAIIVAAAGQDWNARRIERYIALVIDSGARPVVVITKADLAEDIDELIHRTRGLAPSLPVFAVSALTGQGLDRFDEYLLPGVTAVLVGSSGAGKSTLLNRLAGRDLQRVQDIRADDHKGRHTTSVRTLFRLPSGALLIDTPGLREIQLWTSEEDVDATFPEIEALAALCRFRDCTHDSEPGCAVREAIESCAIADDRVAAWRKLRREIEALERRQDPLLAAAERARWRSINREFRRFNKENDR